MKYNAAVAAIAFLMATTFVAADEHDHYLKSVKPILQSRCFACHGVLKQEAGLRLDTTNLMLVGGENGPVIRTGDAAGSELVKRIASHDESIRMPPEGEPLVSSQIDAILAWLNDGAKSPADEQPELDPKEHWAFRAPQRPDVPIEWMQDSMNPIDAFLAESLNAKELKPQPAADPRIWLRRVTLDLIGLPPTESQLNAFALAHDDDSRRKFVEQLLNSPQYGERWGRHWMDIWRYSDWWGLGEEVRNSQKHMWHWRDWIIESLNQDVGYDEMVRQMLAADELYPNDLGRLRASGFLARQYFKFNRTSWLDETIEHTSKAMLGLTFNCCKCHDHKYDPITQQDFYRFRALFEPYQVRMEMVPGVVDFQKDGIPRAFDCNLDAPTYVHARGDDRNPITNSPMAPSVPELLRWEAFPIEPIALPREAGRPATRPYVEESYAADVKNKLQAARQSQESAQRLVEQVDSNATAASKSGVDSKSVSREQAGLELAIAEKATHHLELELEAIPLRFKADREKSDSAMQAAALADKKMVIAKADVEVRRAELVLLKSTPENKYANQKKLEAARAALELAAKQIDAPGNTYVSHRGADKSAESNLETEESRKKDFPESSTGRRTALAKWITDRRNPLAARVAVNHIWARHFGRPLVSTVFDLGRKGAPPTHPKLLDWLAVELMENDWSMKHIHRLIVTSEAYGRTSSNAGAASNIAIDPENRFYWRMNSNRMESQMIRDSLLSLAGELDTKLGGPSVPAANEQSRRRSIYFFHSHNEHNKLLSAFDDASVLDCYRRGESIVPQQSLALENSQFAMEMVDGIVSCIQASSPNVGDLEFARIAFRKILADEPTEQEMQWIEQMMAKMARVSESTEPSQRTKQIRAGLVRGLINHNDFITIR